MIADRADFDYARDAVIGRAIGSICAVIFSPVADRLTAAKLAEYILSSELDVRLGIQLHKIIWPDRQRGV